MIIGVDLDNTIINYNNIFRKIAEEKKINYLKNKNIKSSIKKHLQKTSKNLWTELQGKIYGERVFEAEIFENFKNFLKFANSKKLKVIIISHKTKYPIIGKKINIHKATLKFLKLKLGKYKFKLNKNLFLEETFDQKISKIKDVKCDFFIDDLTKIIASKKFPKTCEGILFGSVIKKFNFKKNWNEIISFFNKKINEINEFDGKNNKIFTLNDKKILVKNFFNLRSKEGFKKEIKFVKFLKKNKIRDIPDICDFSYKDCTIKYKFIKPSKKKINNQIIKKNFNFIKKINDLEFHKEKFDFAKGFNKNTKAYDSELKKKSIN